jgi:hypothetical protein
MVGKNHVIVKYHNRRMPLTVDLSTLLITLFDAYGDDVTVEFVAMNEAERTGSTDKSGAIPMVKDRFQVFEVRHPAEARRRPDIEDAAVAAGVK